MSDLVESLEQMIERKLSDVNTNMPATVVAYDATRNRATVKVTIPKRIGNDDRLEGPKVVEVPVVWPTSGGGKSSFTMPLQPGDGVMLAVQQRSLENWLGGNNDIPDDPRHFDLSDSVAVPGCSSSQTTAHSEDVLLKFNNTELRLKPDGTIAIGNEHGGVTIDGAGLLTIKAQSIKIDTPARSFTLETHLHEMVEPGSGNSGSPKPE